MKFDFAIVQSSISKSVPPSKIVTVDLELLRIGVSQEFAMISEQPRCLQWQEPLMKNVAPPLDNFSEQRITLPLARAQQRENKVKQGVYCQPYLNKWIKGVENVWHCSRVTILYGHE